MSTRLRYRRRPRNRRVQVVLSSDEVSALDHYARLREVTRSTAIRNCLAACQAIGSTWRLDHETGTHEVRDD